MKTTLLLCLALLGMTSLALADKTVKYPKASPVFSITVPDGWETSFEEGALYAHPEDDASTVIEVSPLEATKQEGKKAIEEMKASVEESFKNVKYDPMQEGGSEGLGLYLFNAKGEDDDGKVNLNAIMVTNGDDDRLFMVLVAAPAGAPEEIGKAIGAILASLKKL